MKHIEGNFTGVRNINIFYQGWMPEGDPRAVRFIIHGPGGHGGRQMKRQNRR